jgi:O-antigen/teichoic acid export membrane protein
MLRLQITALRRNAIYSLIAFVVPNVLLLASTPFLIRWLGTENFGLWMLSLATFGLLGAFDLAIGTGVSKFVAEYTTRNDAQALGGTAFTGFVIQIGVGLIVMVPLYLSAGAVAGVIGANGVPQDRVADVVRLSALGFLPLMLKSWALAVSVGLQRFGDVALATIAQNGMTFASALLIVRAGGSVIDVVIASVLALCAVALVMTVLAFRLLSRHGARLAVASRYARQTAHFISATSFTAAGIVLFSAFDRIAVGIAVGLPAVTYYTVSIGVASKVLNFADVVTRPLMPAASSWMGRGRVDVVRAYFRRSSALVALTTVPLCLVLFFSCSPLLHWWLGDAVAHHVVSPFRVLLVVYTTVALIAPSFHIANGVGRPWLPALTTSTGGVATIALIFVLGPRSGVVGAAWANAGYWVNLVLPVSLALWLRAKTRDPTGAPKLDVTRA